MAREYWIVRLVCLAVTSDFYQSMCDDDDDDQFWDLSPVVIKCLTFNNESDADDVAARLCGQYLGEAEAMIGGDRLVYGVSVTGVEILPGYEVVQTSLIRSTGYIPTNVWEGGEC